MAEVSLTDAFVYVHYYDFTVDTSSATLTTDVAQLDATTFNSNGWTEVAGGLKTVSFAHSGFWSVDGSSIQGSDNFASDAVLSPRSTVYTVGPVETEGQVAYMFQASSSQYTLGGQVGELAPFSLTANGGGAQAAAGDGAVRGRLAKAKGTVSATGGTLGSGVNLGALNASQYLYGTFHVFTPTVSAITVKLQSDDNSGFTSPTDLATLTNPIGGNWVTRIAGPITDTWFRYTVTAITGAHVVAGALGKQ